MGLFGKGLVGAIVKSVDNRNRRNAYASMMSNARECKRWECRYCGMRHGDFSRPRANYGGKCKNSPYGTHYWDEV